MDLDKPLPPDIVSVLNAAGILDVSEFEVFRLAWTHWHGAPPADAEIEPWFVRYMFERAVPPWVRSFSRMVEARWREGTLDRGALGLPGAEPSRAMVRRGARYTVAVVTVVLVVVVLAVFTSEVMHLAERCMFPPCY